ncbi:MAG TPA: hypothetical protein VMH90_03850, partial [Thermoplasmata archaeon]|nr:hypothetical protein [Thermoplasmata archaeon]
MPATASPPSSSSPSAKRPGGRRPNPRIASMKRTFYFLSRNGLAMVGLSILIFFAFLALYSFTYTAVPGDAMINYCGTDTGNGFYQPNCQVCTYDSNIVGSSGLPTGWKASNCYEVNSTTAALVPPTVDFSTLHPGPLPLGSLANLPSGSHFYSIYD